MSVNIFDLMKRINKDDANEGTNNLILLPADNLISVNKNNKHTKLEIGAPPELGLMMYHESYSVVTVVIKTSEYNKVLETMKSEGQ